MIKSDDLKIVFVRRPPLNNSQQKILLCHIPQEQDRVPALCRIAQISALCDRVSPRIRNRIRKNIVYVDETIMLNCLYFT
jgi:hypothetical protein